MEFSIEDFAPAEKPVADIGKFIMSNHDYHKSEGVSNSGLTMLERNAGDFIWSKNAPRLDSSSTADFGTALHTCLLEPHEMNSILESPCRGRDTQKFADFVAENPNKIVLTPTEMNQLRLAHGSAMAHPAVNKLLSVKSEREQSIFVRCPETGLKLKIRPDVDFFPTLNLPMLGDVKTTADIAKWRSHSQWHNPLYTLNYGHQAAFYLYVASLHYGVEMKEFRFIVVSKSLEMGSFPVGVFSITKDELIERGFWEQMKSNIYKMHERQSSNNWIETENFSHVGI